MDFWKILEIEQTTDIREIKRAYARKLHECNPEDDPERILQLRNAYGQALDYADTADTYDISLALHTDNDLQYRLAQAYMRDGEYKKALEHLQSLSSDNYAKDLREAILKCEYRSGKISKLRYIIRLKMLQAKKRRGGIILIIVICGLFLFGFFAKYMADVIAPRSNYQRAEKLFKEGDYNSAAAYFKKAGDYEDARQRKVAAEEAGRVAGHQEMAEQYIDNLRLAGYSVTDGYTMSAIRGKGVIVNNGYITFAGYKWRILEIDADNKRALLLLNDILSTSKFSDREPRPDVYEDWSSSMPRLYLNTEFYSSLPEKDKQRVVQMNMRNFTIIRPGLLRATSQTDDYMFLLDAEDAADYFTDDSDRIANVPGSDGGSAWWLRSLSGEECSAAVYISDAGVIMEQGTDFSESLGVRPAIWISLE